MFGRKKCRHQWAEVARKSTPGVLELGASFKSGPFKNPNTPYILYGFTTVELRCKDCGDVATCRLVGSLDAKRKLRGT